MRFAFCEQQLQGWANASMATDRPDDEGVVDVFDGHLSALGEFDLRGEGGWDSDDQDVSPFFDG